MVTRLSDGLTPGDGSDPRTFPSIWNVTAGTIESQGSAITAIEGSAVFYGGTAVPADGNSLVYSTAIPGWTAGEGGGSGNVADDVIQLNFNEITNSYSFPDNFNGVSAGPVSIASGATVTVGTASSWTVV